MLGGHPKFIFHQDRTCIPVISQDRYGSGKLRNILYALLYYALLLLKLGYFYCFKVECYKYQNFILCTEYQCFHIFLCLKFYFPSPFFAVEPFHVVNSLLSHSSCYFLHPQISRSFFSSIRKIYSYQNTFIHKCFSIETYT